MDSQLRYIKAAIFLNIIGTILLSVSLILSTPLGFTITIFFGASFIALGFFLWLILVVKEAFQKGLFE